MSDIEAAKRALVAADKNGDFAAARQLALFIQQQEQPKNPSLMDKLRQRESEIQSLRNQDELGSITPLESVYRQGGQAAGGIMDAVGAGVSSVLGGINDFAQGVPGELLSRGAGAVGQLPSLGGGTIGETVPQELQQVSQEYGQFKQENPRKAGMLEATLNYSGLGVPLGKGAFKEIGEQVYKSGTRKQMGKVQNLVQPKMTKKAREIAQSEGRLKQSIFKDSINPTGIEVRAAEIINDLPEFRGVKGALPKRLSTKGIIVRKEAVARAQNLQKDLGRYNKIKFKRDYVKQNIIENVKKDLIDDPNFWTTGGDLKTQVNNYVEKMTSLLDKNPSTLAGLNKSRIEFDKWARSKTPNVFGDGAATNIKQATKSVRNNINDFIASQVPDEQVKQKLFDSHSLFNAADNISDKVSSQADTALKRLFRTVEDEIPFRTGEMKAGAIGATGLGAIKAPDFFVSGGILYVGGRALNSAQSRKLIGGLLKNNAGALDVATKNALQDYLSELQAKDLGE